MGRFQPAGMARALSATALAQASVGIAALAGGLGFSAPSVPQAIVFDRIFHSAVALVSLSVSDSGA
jgi:hypothetical protein